MGEKKLIPKLRFSGDETYIKTKLEDIANVTGGKRMPKGSLLIDEPNNHPYITVSNMNNNFEDLNEYQYVPEDIYPKIKNYIVDYNDLIISVAGTLGLVKKVPKCLDKANLTENANKISKIKIDIDYLKYYLCTSIIQNRISAVQTNNAQPKLALKEIRSFKINYPSLNEQKKVSKFLTLVDNKIEWLEKKHQNYLNFKKYLMQQIFAQKLRFDFNDEWKKYLLGDISLIGKGFTPSTGNPSFWDGELKWLSIADMNQGKYINHTTKKITSEGSKNKEPILKGTLIMSFKLSIGKLGILTEDMYTNEAICNFKWKNKDVLTEYMYYYLSSINILKYGSQAAKGITLNNETLSTIPVLLPSVEEQKKIINILSDVDVKINMLENSIYDTLKFKKGLLQQMFV